MMELSNLAMLRAVVGYLGEKEQYGWWRCSFFGPGSDSFLAHVFARTAALAQFTAVTNAAAQLHDEYIGVGDTYHLFRLPEDLEQDIHAFFAAPEQKQRLNALTKNHETALAYLQETSLQEVMKPSHASVGPIFVGNLEAVRSTKAWRAAAAHYANAFAQANRAFPYFADRT